MSARKHTPGPWLIGKKGSVVTDTPPSQEYAESESGRDVVEFYGGYVIAESIGASDQPLIAAAPDLLAACERYLAAVTARNDRLAGSAMAEYTRLVEEVTAAQKAMRAAVRKARGEDPRALVVVEVPNASA